MLMQRALRLIYPSECLICRQPTDSDFALCGPCWRETPFIAGLGCHHCGAPLPGEDRGEDVLCDDCLRIARPWSAGRAALRYDDNGRKIVLGIKHGDRADLLRPSGQWMAQAGRDILAGDCLLVPVPLHWSRLLQRRYNQSALLAQAVGSAAGRQVCVDALARVRRTPSLGGQSREARFATLDRAIRPHPKRGAKMAERRVVIVDDVMTSGATLAACCEAAHRAGARDVAVLTLARAAKET